MKKVTSILMAFVLMLTLIPTAWAEGTATALPNAENGVYTLQEDTTISKWTIGKNENWVIDLNGKKLEYTGVSSVTVSDGSTLTIKNGTLVANGVGTSKMKGTGAFLIIQKGCSVELDTVVLKTNGSALYPQGDTARVTVNGSKIYCGVYAVSTNAATVDNYNVVIELKDSTFTTDTGYENGDGDSCPVLINVPGKLTMDNCTVNGTRQGVLVRSGNATITNCTINLKSTQGLDGITGSPLFADNGKYENKNWSSGDEVPMGALIVGNRSKAYQYPATCALTDTKVNGRVYTYGNTAEGKGATLTMGGSCAVVGDIVKGNEAAAISITGGTFNTNPKDYVPAVGFTVAKKDSVYTVSTKTVKEDGTGETTSAVKLEVSSTSGDAVINTTVDQNDIETNKELTVTNNKTAVTINKEGVAAIGTGANLNLSIKADSKTPESANTAAYNKAMAGKDANSAVVVNISLTNGASNVFTTNVANAYALVTVPYSTDKADKLTVYYLNGSDATALTKVADAAAPGAALNTFSYDATNKLITLKLPHFSEYLISTTATRSVVHHYGGSGTTTTTGTKTNSPTTFDAGVGIYAVSAILSVTGMAWVGTKQRKH